MSDYNGDTHTVDHFRSFLKSLRSRGLLETQEEPIRLLR